MLYYKVVKGYTGTTSPRKSVRVGREFPGVSLLSWERWSKSQGIDETSGWAGTEQEGVSTMLILTTSENGSNGCSAVHST